MAMQRVIIHWSGGPNIPTPLDRQHYHYIVAGNGNVVRGIHDVSDNENTRDGDYAAHTLGCNTGSIGVSMAGMLDAREFPFNAGPQPINERQFMAMCMLVRELCEAHNIPVTPRTVLTHAEVQGTLGIRQRGKWDITRLPWRSDLIGAKACGDYMRQIVRNGESAGSANVAAAADPGITVREVQSCLNDAGFHIAVDGSFGPITMRALKAFQSAHGLPPTGELDPRTVLRLRDEPR